ncbi:M48 family metalloprotease [Desulfobacterota bacterium AH_259_B03_O07]|nr:M48 family metalloprotease [Desulfobacterota bacterium AH_259_B03_O07]
MIRIVYINLLLSLFLSGCFTAYKVGKAPIDSAKRISKESKRAKDPITDVEEYYIGRAVAANIVSSYPVLVDDELTTYVSFVGNTVALNSNKPTTYGGYHFAILDTNEINAFASPGGIIFITKGLVDSLENEDELAAVLAHEIAHINNQDGIALIKAARSASAGSLILKEPLRIIGSITPSYIAQLTNYFIQSVDDAFNTVAVNGYSTEQELEADKAAVLYLSRSGYDPSVLLSYQMRLYEEGQTSGVEKMRTHPGAFERMEKLKLNLPPVQVNKTNFELRAERFQATIE